MLGDKKNKLNNKKKNDEAKNIELITHTRQLLFHSVKK